MKAVGVQMQGTDHRVVSGVLEDELYAMECEMLVNWPTLTIEAVQTRMKRFSNTRCPRADKVFALVEGWAIDAELEGKIKKEIGRLGCRHMAILMVDCCRSLVSAELAREIRQARAANPQTDTKEVLETFLGLNPALRGFLRLH
jgi:hypothetical protein